jgi:hypothetical protein
MARAKLTLIDWIQTAIRPLVPMFSQQDEADFYSIFKNAREQYNESVSPLNEKFLKLDDYDKSIVELIINNILHEKEEIRKATEGMGNNPVSHLRVGIPVQQAKEQNQIN